MAVLGRVDHRPWPLPARPWAGRQTWLDLLFAHWPVPARELRRFVPEALDIDERDGTSWVGLVPFRMRDVTLRGAPSLPWLSRFAEMNLRLYVTRDDRPGVWFISLDAARKAAVWAARRWFHLPYFHARIAVREEGPRVSYDAARLEGDAVVRFRARYWPISSPYEAKPGTLEHFLTERYCLYSQAPDGALYRGDVHHQPWPLQHAAAAIEVNDVAGPQGITLTGEPALLHFAKRIDVVVWAVERCDDRRLTR